MYLCRLGSLNTAEFGFIVVKMFYTIVMISHYLTLSWAGIT